MTKSPFEWDQKVRAPHRDAPHTMDASRRPQGIGPLCMIAMLLVASALGWCGGFGSHWLLDAQQGWLRDVKRDYVGSGTKRGNATSEAAIDSVIERIINVESDGDPNAKNSRSSALGLGQFLNETWLDLIRAYRSDLAEGRSDSETLELRRDPKIAREIVVRFAEQNARMLRRRNLPVTPGTIYLAHFAGSAGAVAILQALEDADAASVMASADVTGRTKRDKIIRANPFLERFTVADLRTWADRQMRSPSL